MTATPMVLGGWRPSDETIPRYIALPLAANSQVGKGQFVTVAPSTGFAALNDGTVPNQLPVGQGDFSELTDTSSVAGAAYVRLSERWFSGLLASTASQDGFTAADVGVPFWIATENTLGKKSGTRSIGGLVFGLAFDGTPYAWTGIIAGLLARTVLMANSVIGASHNVSDAAANTATTEVAITRQPFHGLVTSVMYTGDAIAASNTDFVTITISKRDGAGGAAVTIATYDSRAANQGAATQHVPISFALSGTAANLNLLETDIVTITVTKGGAGQQLRGSIRLIQRVI